MKNHIVSFRVYYEDTDAGGIVYYANYLKFAERARTELLRKCEIYQSNLYDEYGIYFVVKHADMKLMRPARLDDIITIETNISEITGASIKMIQTLNVDEIKLVQLDVQVVSVNQAIRPTRIPKIIKKSLEQYAN